MADHPLADRSTDPQYLGGLLQALPNPDAVLRRLGRRQDAFDRMLYDAHVMGEMRSIRAGLLGVPWRVVPGDESRAAARAADLARDVFSRPPAPGAAWEDVMWTIAGAVFRGYAVHEVVATTDGRFTVPAEVVDRPQRRFVFDQAGNDLRLLTRSHPMDGEAVPETTYLVTRHMATYDNPYGVAVLSGVYWPWRFKYSGFQYFERLARRFGMPWPVGHHAGGPDRAAEMADLLMKMLRDGVAAVHTDEKVELLSITGQGRSAQERLISTCNREMSKALTSQTLATEIEGEGSRAASETHREREQAVSKADRALVSRTLTELCGWLTAWNFPDRVPAPAVEFYDEPTAREGWARVLNIARGYLRIPAAEAYERLNIRPPVAGEDLLDAASGGADPGGMEFGRGRRGALSAVIEAIDGDEWRDLAEPLVGPILRRAAADPEATMADLAALYPDMDADALEERLARLLFVADLWSRVGPAAAD